MSAIAVLAIMGGVTQDGREPGLPEGTVTFLVAELVRSRGSGETPPGTDGVTGEDCGELVHPVVATHGGRPIAEPGGPGTAAVVFTSLASASAAALELQRMLAADRPQGGPDARLRVALHTSEVRLGDDGRYTDGGLSFSRRLCQVAHGGQIVASAVTASLVSDVLPRGARLADLGAHRLRDLSRPERVFELRPADLREEFPRLRSLDVLANNLPSQVTSFVGRSDELAAVKGLLGRERLVTLTGSGGCGKTRLAVQTVADLADRWPDGVWWIDLGPLIDSSRVAELVASTIKVMVEPVTGPLRALAVQLRDRQLLVCLDNCEHLLDAAADLADALLRSCPHVSLLATSREPLGLQGETVWRVPSMIEPEAVALFTERATQVRPGFGDDDGSETWVPMICRRLDGIPLALELAAAWVRTLTPAQIAAGLDDRFRLLSGGRRGVIARQQTLGASVSWSHDLLDPLERAVFRRLAIFSGGFTIDAARAVCAEDPVSRSDVLAPIDRLVDKSLVIAEHPESEARYRLLETIRQYAYDRLDAADETVATRDRHLDHFLALAERAEPELEDADQDVWLARLETEHDNIHAALDWGLSAADPGRGRRLAAALPQLWLLHGHCHDGIGYLEQALAAAPDDRSVLQTKLLVGLALVAAAGARLDLTVDAATRGLDLANDDDDDRHRGRCLDLLAYAHVYLDFATAQDLCLRARRHAEAADDAVAVDFSLALEGMALANRDRHDEAAPVLDAAATRARRRGDRNLAAFALMGQLHGALLTGDVRGADGLGTEALRLAEPLADYFTIGAATSDLAWVKGVAGDIVGARCLMDTVIRSLEGANDAVAAPFMAVTLGRLHLWDDDIARAITWLERATRFAAPLVDNQIVARALPLLAAAHRRLGALDTAREHANRAVALARKLDLPHVLAEALDETARLVAADDPERADNLHHEALAVRVRHRIRIFYTDSLDALGSTAARTDRPIEATRLYAASDAARALIGYPRPRFDQTHRETMITALRSALGADGFDSAWAEGTQLSLEEAVAYASRARGARGRPSSGWASLTPTELKVVGLAAEGLTNRDIGSRLLMSANTVKTHLTHIFAKLDVSNRTELAAIASARRDDPQRDP